ncbi:MAG TPA: glycosyltransferase family 2 protein [Trueperaceae bacterium]
MPGRKLTIAIPTFNRARLLDEQLCWLARAIKGYESECELLICDNASTDDTADVIERHVEQLGGGDLAVRHVVQPRNVGAIRNIIYCISNAGGEYVWTVSDDDEIDEDAVGKVLELIDANSNLALILLNFSTRHHRTGKRKFRRCFENECDENVENGALLFEKYLAERQPSRWGGLALTTAVVYRSRDAREALSRWPDASKNLTMQLFISGYCARNGRMAVTHQPMLEMIGGRHFFESDVELYTRFRFAQVPEAFVKLIEIGYSATLLRRKILEVRHEVRWRFVLKMLLRRPRLIAVTARRYLASLMAAERLARRETLRRPQAPLVTSTK